MNAINSAYDLRELLYLRFKRMEELLFHQMKHTKYDFLTLSQMRIFAFMRGRDMTISDLAKRLNVSRQAVQKTISSLVDHGLLRLTESPINRSAKLIVITDEGHKMRSAINEIGEKSEEDLALKIGSDRLLELKTILKENWGS